MNDCRECKWCIVTYDGIELCKKRIWNCISGHIVGGVRKIYGFPALPIYAERTCKDYESNKE